MFEDVIDNLNARALCQNKKQIGFRLQNSAPICMLISKDDLKIRLQTSQFSAFLLPLKSLLSRLEEQFAHSDSGCEISLLDTIPLNELFQAIDDHFGIKSEIARIKTILNDRSL